jgi:HAE1 family hydrophobic/amphiphilic exporter-1
MLVDEVIANLRPKLSGFPGMRVFLQNPPTIRIGGQVTKSIYQFSMQSPDKPALYAAAEKMREAVERLPSVEDVTSDLAISTPQVHVKIDRDKAAAMQVTAAQIENALYDAYGPRWVSTIYAAINEYRVLLELKPEYQADPKALSLLYFKSNTGRLIPLDTLAEVELDSGPQTINHFGQLHAVTVSFNLKPGASLGDVVGQVQKAAEEVLPPEISSTFQGAAKAFQGSLSNLWVLLIVAILVVYIVLGVLYESYIHPFTILSGLPSAGFGALLTLFVFRMDLSIYAFVGLIMLIGIVQKNAIMQIDFALEAEREGMPPKEAIYEGCLIRFRPIMMTTMAALLGAVPIALGYGAGGEARQPLGLVVVGGLLFSQLVTLYLTPVVYTYMAALQTRLQGKKAHPIAAPEPTVA